MATADCQNCESFTVESVVRGHHVYKSTWTPEIGQTLQTAAEEANREDRYAVSVTLSGQIVGHIPREISKTCWYFIHHNGSIEGEVTGKRKLSTVPGKGLEVPCKYNFRGKPALIKTLTKLLVKELQLDR